MPALALLIPLIEALPKVVAAAPEFKKLFDVFVGEFSTSDQSQLQSAYAKARAGSDSAQDDFVDASRGD